MLFQDRQKVKQLAAAQHSENENFRNYLYSSHTSAQVDGLFSETGAAVASQIDCTLCAACCHTLEPELSEQEHSLVENKDPAVVLTVPDSGTSRLYLKSPCCFLKGNLCSVYDVRPAACKGYPHLEEPGVRYRLRTVFAQAGVCPIVFHTIQKLKAETGFIST